MTIFNLLVKFNPRALEVLQKIFKKFLFDRVPTVERMKTHWGQAEWFNFFIVARRENSIGPMNYWNEQCRKDCMQGLER